MPKTKTNVAKHKTTATPAKRPPKQTKNVDNLDGVYLLKLLLYVLLGSLWIKLSHGASATVPIPIGFVFGLLFATHEHFRIDRKIEYAVLLVAMLVGYFAPYGLYITY